jgi:hypothetical protein
MPLARYFFFVGAALLALLFISNQVLPQVPVTDRTEASPDKYSIRIHSVQKWPERVVFDTSIQPSAPAMAAGTETAKTVTAKTEAAAPAPATVAEFTAKAHVREAFAQFRPSADVTQLQPSEPKKLEPAAPPKRKIAKRRVAPPPPMMLVAQQPQFGFFGRNTW